MYLLLFGLKLGKPLEKYMRKGRAEKGAVDVRAFLLGEKHVLTFRTKHLDSALFEFVGKSNGNHVLLRAENSRTSPEDSVEDLLPHQK